MRIFKNLSLLMVALVFTASCGEKNKGPDLPEGVSYEVIEGAGVPVKRLTSSWLKVEQAMLTEGEQREPTLTIVDMKRFDEVFSGASLAYQMTPIGETWKWSISKENISDDPTPVEIADYTLILKVLEEVDPLPAPTPYDHIPEDAMMTESGVGYKIIQEGDGVTFPNLTQNIEVYYSLWTADGKLASSPRMIEQKNIFPLGVLIPGWQDALIKMSKGSRAIIWIPGDLAYDLREDRPFSPKGMLIFDVELFDITDPEPETKE